MAGTRAISTTSRRELSLSFFFLQGHATKEIHAILTETLACFLPDRAKDLSAPLHGSCSQNSLLSLCINHFSTSFLITFLFLQINWRSGTNCSTVRFCRITSTYQPTNAHIISHKTLLKHFKTLLHISILLDHHQGALFLAKIILQYSQFISYLQTRCCGSISCCVVEQWLGVGRTTHT